MSGDELATYRTFDGIAATLYNEGVLCDADLFVFCMTCEDVCASWAQDSDVCACCGFVVLPTLPYAMSRPN